MSYRKLAAAAVVALLAPVAAEAQAVSYGVANVVNVAITLPTQYRTGRALLENDIKYIVLEWRYGSSRGISATLAGSVALPPSITNFEIDLVCGTYVFDAYVETDQGQSGETGWSIPVDTGIPCD